MYSIVFFALISTIFASPTPSENILNNVPECKALLDEGENAYSIPHCNAEVNACFKEAHAMAPACLAKTMKDWKDNSPDKYQCMTKDNMKSLKKDWFAASCKWHTGVVKCMKGDATGGDFPVPHEEIDHHAAHAHGRDQIKQHVDKFTQRHDCWKALHEKMDECSKKAEAQCHNFNICDGHEMPPDNATEQLQNWHKVAMKLKADKHEKMRAFVTEMKTCLHEVEDNQENLDETDAHGDHGDHETGSEDGVHGHHGMN